MAAAPGEREYYESVNDNMFMWNFDTQSEWGWDAVRLWHHTTAVSQYRFEGDITWLDEISEEDARKKFPGAFESEPENYSGRGLTTEEIASLAARAATPATFEQVMADHEIPGSRWGEARRIFDWNRERVENLNPERTLTLPNTQG